MTVDEQISAAQHPFLDGTLKRLLINGRLIEATSRRSFDSLNPATGQLLARVSEGDASDINLAVAAARRAFDDGRWSQMKPFDRQTILSRFADLVDERHDEIARLDTLDMGMPLARTMGNRRRAVGMMRFYAGLTTALRGDTIENSIPGDYLTYTLKEPVGVVGAIIPWNNPHIAFIWKVGAALAAGCTVVLKPAEEASLPALLLGELLLAAGVPDGVVNVVPGVGEVAGAALAAPTDVVFADADLDQAVPGAALAAFGNSGQVCSAGTRLFVQRDIYEEFMQRVAAFTEGLHVGNGMSDGVQLGPVVSQVQLERVMGYFTIARDEGATVLVGGERLVNGDLSKGYFIAPTIFTDVHDEMRVAREEIFGPVVSAVVFDDTDDLISRANANSFGLGSGVWTQNVATAHRYAKAIRAGSVWVNCYNLMDPAVPFGGYKMSGYGREGGVEQLDEFLETKAVWIKTS